MVVTKILSKLIIFDSCKLGYYCWKKFDSCDLTCNFVTHNKDDKNKI